MDIVKVPDDVLLQQSALIPDINDEIKQLALNMIESMHEANGIGLAAIQVGLHKRMFVVHIEGDKPRVFINPEIIGTSQEVSSYEEGCLSIPGVYGDVIRPEAVSIQAWNERGRPFTLDADGILARVIQHEYDHLNGRLFIDHLNEKKRTRVMDPYYKKLKA